MVISHSSSEFHRGPGERAKPRYQISRADAAAYFPSDTTINQSWYRDDRPMFTKRLFEGNREQDSSSIPKLSSHSRTDRTTTKCCLRFVPCQGCLCSVVIYKCRRLFAKTQKASIQVCAPSFRSGSILGKSTISRGRNLSRGGQCQGSLASFS